MKIEELKRISNINKEIEMWKKDLAKLECQSLAKGQKITGMPRSSIEPPDSTGNTATEIADIKFVIEGRLIEIQLQRKRILEYIFGIEDSIIRQVIFYRHIALMSWNDVARNIGGGNTGDGLRIMHDRYIE